MNNKISIIVPIYKTEKYLKKCINSVLQQDYKDFELILINDGSPDGSEQICKYFESNDSRIIYLYQENKGVSEARNYGIKVSNGKYITFVDSDDYLEYNHLSTLYSLIQKSKTDLVSLSYCSHNQEREYLYNRDETFEAMISNDDFGVAIHNKLFKTDIIKMNKLKFNSSLKIAEDFDFMIKYIVYISSSVFFKHKSTYIKVDSENNSAILTNYNEKLNGLIYCKELINNDLFKNNAVMKNALTIREFRICSGSYFFHPEKNMTQYTKFIKEFLKENYYFCITSNKVELKYKILSTLLLINPKIIYYIRKIIK